MDRNLYEASLKGSVTSLLELLREDPLTLDRMIVDCAAETPLHIAAILGHVDFSIELTKRKPELARELNLRRQSPLHLASAKGYIEIVKLLLSIGPEICLVRDRDGKSPLHLAAIKGQIEVLNELVRARPDATRVAMDRGQTILHLCVKHDRLEVLKQLLNSIGDNEFVNLKDEDGNTVLHLAVAEKQIEAIKLLLSTTGIDVNSLNANGLTALDVLTQSPRDLKDTDIGEALRDAGALRVRDMSPTARASIIRPIAAQPPSQGSSWEKHLKKHEVWLKNKQSALMVVASLIATMTFQAGINPPGGVWQDDDPSDPYHIGHVAGSSIMAHKNPVGYRRLLGVNTIGFIASLSIILLLISGLPLKHRIFMWILMVIMWIAISSTTLTYLLSIRILTPGHVREPMCNVMNFPIFVWLSFMALFLLGHTIRLLLKTLRKGRRLRNNQVNP